MEEAPSPILTHKIEETITKTIKINEKDIIRKLNIITKDDIIIFKILYQESLLIEYSCKYTLNELKLLHKIFSLLTSFKEFIDYIVNLSNQNKISIQKEEEYLLLNLDVEYLLNKYNIQIKLIKEKINVELNFINIFKQMTGLKNIIKNIYNENKNLKEEIDKKNNDIINLYKENNTLIFLFYINLFITN